LAALPLSVNAHVRTTIHLSSSFGQTDALPFHHQTAVFLRVFSTKTTFIAKKYLPVLRVYAGLEDGGYDHLQVRRRIFMFASESSYGTLRFNLDGIETDDEANCRFFIFLEKRAAKWGVSLFTLIPGEIAHETLHRGTLFWVLETLEGG
jgi:hypothetical protein